MTQNAKNARLSSLCKNNGIREAGKNTFCSLERPGLCVYKSILMEFVTIQWHATPYTEITPSM